MAAECGVIGDHSLEPDVDRPRQELDAKRLAGRQSIQRSAQRVSCGAALPKNSK